MNLKRIIGLILVITGVILGVAKALGGEGQSGDWTIRRSDAPGRVEFSLMNSRAGHHFHYSSDWPASDFFGTGFFQVRTTRSSFYASRGTQENSNARDFCRTARVRGCFISQLSRSILRR